MLSDPFPTGIRVLIVEDEAIIATDLAHRLERHGATVIGPVDSASAAVEAARTSNVGLVLMDIRLKGGSDGIDAAEAIYASYDVPIVFLTANADEATRRRSRIAAQFGYVLKPFLERELLAAMELALHRHRVERDLRRANLTYDAIGASLAEAVVAADARGFVQLCNPAAEQLTGWRQEEARGRALGLILPMHEELTGSAIDLAALASGARSARTRVGAVLRARDERRVPVEVSAALVAGAVAADAGIVVTLRDMSEPRRAEMVLRESEARFRSAFDLAGIGMALVSPTGEFLRVNGSLCTMLGRREAELLGTDDHAITHPDDLEVQHAEGCALLKGERDVVRYEKRYLHARGEPLWVTVTLSLVRTEDGAPHYLLAQVQDVDQRKRLLTDLMAMNARYERYEAALTRLTRNEVAMAGDATEGLTEALHAISEVVAETLDVDRVDIWQLAEDESAFVAADVFERGSGRHTSGERLGRADHPAIFDEQWSDQQVIAWDERDHASPFAAFARRVLVPIGVRSYLRALVRNNGRWIGVLSASRRGPPRPWTPDEQSFLVAVSNIVAARIANAAHRRMEQRIREGEKMAAIGQLAGGIAHDFNNLLAVIQGCSDLLLAQLPAEMADERELTGAVREAGQRAALLTRQLLLFSRSAPSVARVVQPNDVVSGLAAMLQRLLGEEVQLALSLAPDLLAVRIDPSQLEQVVMNLVVNARDAMPGGGRIALATRNAGIDEVVSQAPPSLVGTARRRRFIQLVVRDSGTGIAPDVLPRIFEPFFTTKTPGKGTGLGLATVYAIAENAGGFVTVNSRLGDGSSFALWLPGTLDDLTPTPHRDAASSPEMRATILLVEDEEVVRRITTRMLEQRAFVVLAVPSADEALALLDARDGQVDLVLTDVAMPSMGGGQLAERVRVRWPHLPVVFMSGYHEDALLHGASASQHDILIHKPFSGEALYRFVAGHLQR